MAHELCPVQQRVIYDGSRILGQRPLPFNAAAHQPCPPSTYAHRLPQTLPVGLSTGLLRQIWYFRLLNFMCSKPFTLTVHSKKISRSKNIDNYFLFTGCPMSLSRLKLRSSGRGAKVCPVIKAAKVLKHPVWSVALNLWEAIWAVGDFLWVPTHTFPGKLRIHDLFPQYLE